MAVLTDRGRETRAREVENAIATGRLEGLEPSAGAQQIFQRYIDGELTSEEMDREFMKYIDSTYGPVRLPRDQRS